MTLFELMVRPADDTAVLSIFTYTCLYMYVSICLRKNPAPHTPAPFSTFVDKWHTRRSGQVVNNWNVIVAGFVAVTNKSARIFFVIWFVQNSNSIQTVSGICVQHCSPRHAHNHLCHHRSRMRILTLTTSSSVSALHGPALLTGTGNSDNASGGESTAAG